MRVSLWPSVLATTSSGVPFMTAWLAKVWRVTWKFAGGLILARADASAIGRIWCDLPHALPSRFVKIRSVPLWPAHARSKNRQPSSDKWV